MLKFIKSLFGLPSGAKTPVPSLELADWYHVTWDDKCIYRHVRPPGQDGYDDSFEWARIIRICFVANDVFSPDELLIFTSTRPESYLIPIEAKGAPELWDLILERELFDVALALEAATAPTGTFCWPQHED